MTSLTTVHTLAIGAHADDIEVGAGGLLARLHHEQQQKIALLDLTDAALGTNGTPTQRRSESTIAAKILGCTTRIHGTFADGTLKPYDHEQLEYLVTHIRTLRPQYIVGPYGRDRHPDHAATHELVQQAIFYAGLKKFLPHLPPHRTEQVLWYLLHETILPTIIIDISTTYDFKRLAINAYESQFVKTYNSDHTPINSNAFLQSLETKQKYYGNLINTTYGEGYMLTQGIIGIHSLEQLQYMA